MAYPTDDDPKSVYAMLPKWMKDLCDAIPDEILDKTSWELTEILFPDGVPSAPAHLRILFWREYDRAVMDGDCLINFMDVHQPTYTMQRMRRVLSDPNFLAWLLRRPPGYRDILEEASELALSRQIEVMKMAVMDKKTGKPNVKLIEVQARIFQHLDARLKGGFIQKTENKNLNVTVEGKTQLGPTKQLSLAAVNEELDRLRKISELLMAPANVKLDPGKMITGETMDAEVVNETATPDVRDPKGDTI